MNWIRNNLALVAFLVVALAAGLAIERSSQADAESLWRSNLASCERVNKLREAHNSQAQAVETFIEEAIAARQMTADAASDPAERRANQNVANRYREVVKQVTVVQLTDCEEAFPRP